MAPPLSGTGEMATLVRERDWSGSPLGAVEQWPPSLRTAVNILLTSRYAMWIGWGDSLTFLYNDAYRPTLGIKHPWALGRATKDVWAEIWPDIESRIAGVLSTGVATYDEGLLLFLQRSGFSEETYHTFSYSPLSNDSGRMSGIFCVVAEETERVINERRMATLRELASALSAANTQSEVLATTERQLSANTKDLPFTLVYLYDAHGEARLACTTGIAPGHPAAPESIGAFSDSPWPAQEVFRSRSSHVMDLDDQGLPKGSWDKAPVQAAVVAIKQQAQERPAGFLVAGINPYRRYDEAYSGFVDLIAGQLASGIANARALEEERRRAESLAELDRAKTAFFSNVSHEFRTPLTLMLGPIEDILAKSQDQVFPANRELLQVVQRNGLRLQRLVNTLLDFSRIEAGRVQANYEPTDLAAYTAELASNFRSAMEKAGLRYSVDCSKLSKPVYVDREMWEKIVLNLLSNAFKYTLEGSVSLRLIERGNAVELLVTDTGAGIPEGELAHIFERFHRVPQARGRTHEGTGIGLALVQELVKLHGGWVSAQSEFGRGSTFTVSIPFGTEHLPKDRIGAGRSITSTALHAETYVEEALRWLPGDGAALTDSAFRGEAAQTETASRRSARSRILLADDNPDMRQYVQRLLSPRYEVTAVADGQEALTAALANPPDLVLSDVMMPVMDGFGLLSALRSHPTTRTAPFILLSARAGEEASVEGLEAGADDYLIKPFSARELLARVGAQLALKRERERAHAFLTEVFSQAPVGIVVIRGRDFVVELANPSYQTLFPGRDLIGRRFIDVAPEVNQDVWDAFRHVYDTGEPVVANDWYVPYDQDGDGIREDHWFNVVYHPMREGDGTVSGLISVSTEVTAQVLARKELERANRELEEFAYVASHDLQEPLRMVHGFTQLLLRRHINTDNKEAQEFADYIRGGVRRMEQLIRDLLSYSRSLHRGEVIPVSDDEVADLNAAWADALEIMKDRIAESGAQVSAPTLPRVLGDEKQFAHVFQNLLSNALKYRKKDVPPQVSVSAESRDGMWVVAIRDNGIGFEQQYAHQIFGLFKRLHRDAYPGTGLGLAICQRIVERYKGRIWAESQDGVGSTFYVALRPSEPVGALVK